MSGIRLMVVGIIFSGTIAYAENDETSVLFNDVVVAIEKVKGKIAPGGVTAKVVITGKITNDGGQPLPFGNSSIEVKVLKYEQKSFVSLPRHALAQDKSSDNAGVIEPSGSRDFRVTAKLNTFVPEKGDRYLFIVRLQGDVGAALVDVKD